MTKIGTRDESVSSAISIRNIAAIVAAGTLLLAAQAYGAESVPLPKPRPTSAPAKVAAGVTPAPRAQPPAPRFAVAGNDFTPPAEIAVVQEAVTAARRGRTEQAAELQKTVNDPVARKLIEWTILRSEDSNSVDAGRLAAFIAENASWPAISLLRRRAEVTLWTDRLDPAFVRNFFSKERPITATG